MLKIGLTGGIGSGKTQVADWLASWGVSVIDTDQIAHALTAPGGQAIEPLCRQFGPEALDATGALNRHKMRELVFADPNRRRELESIMHPLIAQEVQLQAARVSGLYVVFVVPLLVESGRWLDRVDRVCVVDCDQPTQIQRVQARSGLAIETIQQILNAQATREQRLAVADDILVNSAQTKLTDLEGQVLDLHRCWCKLVT
jgi:dephospho-CoA kinase